MIRPNETRPNALSTVREADRIPVGTFHGDDYLPVGTFH